VYKRCATLTLHNARNGGSIRSSIGARNKGKSGSSMLPIFIKLSILNEPAFLNSKKLAVNLRLKISDDHYRQKFKKL
jgi:hypothetical protein